MIEAQILKDKLDEVREQLRSIQRQRWMIRLMWITALCAAGFVALASFDSDLARRYTPLLLVPVLFMLLLPRWLAKLSRWSDLEIARLIEQRHPELNAVLLTATEKMEVSSDDLFMGRLLIEATDQSAVQNWPVTVTRKAQRKINWQMALADVVACLALAGIVYAFWPQPNATLETLAQEVAPVPIETPTDFEVTLSPGDVEIERGSRVIVEAKFGQATPAEATLVLCEIEGQERERIPMRLTVDEQVFGGLIAKVDKDTRYHVEFGEGRSKVHTLTTFVYPALERVDVTITPPAYTKQPTKEIKNTRKVTAMEDSTLEFTFKINKPVQDAELFGEDKTIVPLKASAKDPTILTAMMKAEKTQKWRLHLVDNQQRANKNPPWISVTVQTNQLAKIEVVFPKRDIQVSQIQELPVEAKVWDDLGVVKSGASFSIAGRTKEVIFKHGVTEPAKKHDVKEMLALEHESASPRQLVSYHFWAEDTGPQGEVRRAMSDMFFADVRHFEDIFREAEAPPSEPGKEKKSDTDKLVELQKQVVNATWRLIRDTNAGRVMEAAAPDVDVVHESQELALVQTKDAMEKGEDAEIKTALTEAWKSMKDALDPLVQASSEKKRAALNQALTFEQSALEWLHRAQSREHRVMRQNQPSQSSSASQQAKQNQLMNLELKQEEQRYEEEKVATEEQTAEQQENLQVLNRLKELARRQEALAEKMKELEKQIEKAKSEEEKQELANQLKRLQDEQEQLLQDVDDLQERMQKSDSAANMAEAKEQLEQTREQVMDAAEKLKEEKVADAANAATRAQRELEKMQEDFKEKTAKRFSDEMKQVRQQAREVAEKQKQINESLENQKTGEPSSDTSSSLDKMLSGSQVARQIEDQGEKVQELLENMRRISEQAEGNNPLLHRRLYEAVRDAQTGGLEENLEEARMQSRYGNRADAQEAERKASTSVEQLQKGVEKAAESVLGSETETLRMARAELDKLIDEVGQESHQEGQNTQAGQEPGGKAKAEQMAGNQKGASEQAPEKEPTPGNQPGSQQAEAESAKSDQASKPPGEAPKVAQGKSPGGAESQTGISMQQGGAEKEQGSPSSKTPSDTPTQGTPQLSANRSPKQPGDRESPHARGGGSGEGDVGSVLFFDEGTETPNARPLTGTGYEQWTDRLRNVEELLNQPELRNEAAKVLDNARAMRIAHERNDVAPQSDHLQMRITEPLVELRNRVAEELAKRDTKNPMVPVDRDPVPPAFRELVKRYYKELGNGN